MVQTKDKIIFLAAVDTVCSFAKHLIFLSVGMFLVTMVFGLRVESPVDYPFLAITSWIAFFVAIVLGFFLLGALAAILSLGRKANLDIYQTVRRSLALAQLVAFTIGLGFGLAFMAVNLP